MIKILKYIFSIALIAAFVSCKDDFVIDPDPENGNGIEIEGDCIKFDMQLDKDMVEFGSGVYATESNEYFMSHQTYNPDMENYIDTQNKLRVFFFTEYGDFIFGAIDRVVLTASNQNLTTDNWQVRIPMNVLVDREGSEYDVDKIKEYLKTHKFKIAVLANWPNKGERNPSDYDDSNDNTTNYESLKGEPLWGWKNSILNPAAKEGDLKNINDLHHLYDDATYQKNISNYGFAMKDNKYMGQPVNWVVNHDIAKGWKDGTPPPENFSSNTLNANDWIRKYWDPSVRKNEDRAIYRHYQYLQYLWDFDAAWNSEKGKYDRYNDNTRWSSDLQKKSPQPENHFGEQWFENRNGKELQAWMKKSYNNNNKIALESWDEGSTGIGNVNNCLTYISGNSTSKYTSKSQTGGKVISGLSLSAGSTTKGALKFTARTSGDLRIRCSSSSDGKTSKMAVKIGDETTTHSVTGTDADEILIEKITIDDQAKDIYIYSADGSLIIYYIEYIRGVQYLAYTDREGLLPSQSSPIPMYGVQQFDALSTWTYGSTYDLTAEQKKYIWLLRSVSKVEVYIPRRFGKIAHMLMRSMNRHARCEPINVETDTKKLWDEDHAIENDATKPKQNAEISKLMGYRHCYPNGSYLAGAYVDWLKWFYGSWNDTYWKNPRTKTDKNEWNTQPSSKNGWGITGFLSGAGNKYPSIFNAYISRTDFASFFYAGTDGDYDVYVLYMPEKFMDDPTSVGNRSSIPKVAHIEYRFEEEKVEDDYYHNSQFNLEDNDCYRIYFTNYGDPNLDSKFYPVNDKIASIKKNGYEAYEQTDAINKHWPIIRNHIYQFFLGGSGPETPEIKVRVKQWKYEKVTVEW